MFLHHTFNPTHPTSLTNKTTMSNSKRYLPLKNDPDTKRFKTTPTEFIQTPVLNLSNLPIEQSTLDLLSLGLTFIPTPTTVKVSDLQNQHNRLIRSIKIIDYFQNNIHSFNSNQRFSPPSKWIPPLHKLSPDCLLLCQDLHIEFQKMLTKHRQMNPHTANADYFNNQVHHNLTNHQKQTLRTISKHQDLIIKKADKSSTITILDKSRYLEEVLSQLSDDNYYSIIDHPTTSVSITINKLFKQLLLEKYISHKQYCFFIPSKARDRHFYILPKTHKPQTSWSNPFMPKGRPIISNCASETHRVSLYLDQFLKQLATQHPSYIKDSYDFVHKIQNKVISTHSILVTADITSLYTNMKLHLTMDSVINQFKLHPNPARPDHILLRLLNILLHFNEFSFDDTYYRQTCGIAMGLSSAPHLANIFLITFDHLATSGFHITPSYYFRFLDDIFFIFEGSLLELDNYLHYLNSLIPGIKLTFTYDLNNINFLDMTIFKHYVPESQFPTLQTKIYFKPTDNHLLLHTASYHPPHFFKSVVKSQLIRFGRLTSFKSDFDLSCKILFNSLQKRGYRNSYLTKLKRSILHREGLITNHSTPNHIPLPMVLSYNSFNIELSKAYRSKINSYRFMTQYRPIVAYSTAQNFCNILIKSKFTH